MYIYRRHIQRVGIAVFGRSSGRTSVGTSYILTDFFVTPSVLPVVKFAMKTYGGVDV
jgi:hypothetical protein